MRFAIVAASLSLLAVYAGAAEPKGRLPVFGCANVHSAYRPERPQDFYPHSPSAMKITGDITVERDHIVFQGTGPGVSPPYVKAEMRLHYLGPWQAMGRQLADTHGGCLALYEIRPPFSTRLRTAGLCGGSADDIPAAYLAASQDNAREISLYVFPADADFDSPAREATKICGTFTFYLEDKK